MCDHKEGPPWKSQLPECSSRAVSDEDTYVPPAHLTSEQSSLTRVWRHVHSCRISLKGGLAEWGLAEDRM